MGSRLDAPGAPRVTWGQPDPAHGLPRAPWPRGWAQLLGDLVLDPRRQGGGASGRTLRPTRIGWSHPRGAGDPDHRAQDLGARRPRV